MPSFPPIVVRHPQPFDLVDDPIQVSGLRAGFEGQFSARVRDGNGAQLALVTLTAGGTGTWANFQATVDLPNVPPTPHGTLEVFEPSAAGDGNELHKVVVAITFGRALLDPYHGFAQHTAAAGETLTAIAQQWYGNGALWPRIHEANRDQIAHPNVIFVGQVLRIPQ